MDEEEMLIADDDSVFEALVNDSVNISSDAIVDDSFSSVQGETEENVFTSTPVGPPARSSRRLQVPRPSTPTLPPAPECDTDSPSMSTRSRTRENTPTRATESPRPRTRSARPATPTLRSDSQCDPSSPSMSTRSRTRGNTPTRSESPGPRRSARSATSTQSSEQTVRSSRQTEESIRPLRPSTRRGASNSTCQSPVRPSTSTTNTTVPVLSRPRAAANTASRIKCTQCTSTLANERTYQVHKKMHTMKRAFAKIAKPEQFMEKLPELILNSLNCLLAEKHVGKYAEDLHCYTEEIKTTFSSWEEDHDFLCKFLHENLYNILSNHCSVFSSSLVCAFYVGVNALMNQLEFKDNLKRYIVALGDTKVPKMEVLNLFLGHFMILLSNEVLLYFIRTIHGATASDEIRRKRSSDKLDSTTFLELVYYIGGSVVSALLFKANKYKDSSQRWNTFDEVLQLKFLRIEAVGNSCSNEVSNFTEAVDRGGLTHISQEALDFFVVLFDFLMSLEGHDGTLPKNVVEDHVLANVTIVCLWDVLVGTQLDDDKSLDFLMQTSNSCMLIVMKGIMKRRLNSQIKKAIASVSLRSRLAE